GVQAAGSVHHIAWACSDEEHEAWRRRLSDSGAEVTPIIDRTYFRSIYFREPNGILFEIATRGPGFTVDESAADLGTGLQLPPQYESMRSNLESQLTPLRNPRAL
ncbi:MAG TPA: VOC family protein, partial [Actinomycetota bacterium]|nr:VOC family protein [Actinomycetota bacterium]